MFNLFLALVSLAVVLKAADIFVNHSSALAKKYQISSFLIGFTIMAFGTSLPELIVSTYSNIIGHPALTISNVIGSNIANLCLILGLLALFKNFKLSKQDVHFNIPINLLGSILFTIFLWLAGWQLNWWLGSILLLIFPFFIWLASRNNHLITIKGKTQFSIIKFALSFILLTIFGKLCIDNLLIFAQLYQISDSILGHFFLAIGTSLPELVTTFLAVKKGNNELGIGNLLGSNLFNLFFILGINSLIHTLDFSAFYQDILFLLFATCVFLIFSLIGKKYYFSKKEGLGLVLLYVLFMIWQGSLIF
jgi:cation:H+ antiporter